MTREDEQVERHPSYGLIQVSKVGGGGVRLFGSQVRHDHFYQIRVYRGARRLRRDGVSYEMEDSLPLLEFHLSPAQFVEMITNQNMWIGVPVTLSSVAGEHIPRPPEDAGSELKVTIDVFREQLKHSIKELWASRKTTHELLNKVRLTIEDKKQIKDTMERALYIVEREAPYIMELITEHGEKITARGKAELDAVISHTLVRAGIQSLRLKSGDEE